MTHRRAVLLGGPYASAEVELGAGDPPWSVQLAIEWLDQMRKLSRFRMPT